MTPTPTTDSTVVEIEGLIDAYWDIAFVEGESGRTTDTPDGRAQETRSAISRRLRALASRTPNTEMVVKADQIAGYCATEGCDNAGTERFEAGGVGSVYCPGCAASIEVLFRNDRPVMLSEVRKVIYRIAGQLKGQIPEQVFWGLADSIESHALASPPSPAEVTVTDEMVAEAMHDAWNEICSDTGCHPLDIERHGKELFFHPLHWSRFTAIHLRAALQLNKKG
jgi:hypothetical protein